MTDYLEEFSSGKDAAYKNRLVYVAGYSEYLYDKKIG